MATKYPIILVHGIMLKDIWRFKAFGNIERILKSQGNLTFTANHDGLGTIESNAAQLKEYINEIAEKHNAPRVNIIAHSKGGLDILYMIDRLGMADKVASVTFLCTPHKGSVIAEKLYGLPRVIRSPLVFFLNTAYRVFGDKSPNALEVCRQLRSNPHGVLDLERGHIKIDLGKDRHADIKPDAEACFGGECKTKSELSEISGGSKSESQNTSQAENSPHPYAVFMQSFSSTLKRSRDDFLMGIPLYFSRKYEALESDGMVSVESSKFALYRGSCTDASVSHSEIVDLLAKKSKKEKIYTFYLTLAQELEEMGF